MILLLLLMKALTRGDNPYYNNLSPIGIGVFIYGF